MKNAEQIFLGSCLLDNALIDHAVQAGIKTDAFESPERQTIWRAFLGMRTSGKPVDSTSIYLEMKDGCPSEELFACEQSVGTSAHGKKALKAVVDAASIRRLKPALFELQAAIEEGTDVKTLKSRVEALESILRPSEPAEKTMAEIAAEARLYVDQHSKPAKEAPPVITTGFRKFDDEASPIEMHEYVLLGARTSHGKSSMATQMTHHNATRGMRGAYFTLETSARSVVLQMAAQVTGANLKLFRKNQELPERVKAMHEEINRIEKLPILIFENDMSLDAITARCRMLAASFKPHFVVIDYCGLIKEPAKSEYERLTKISKAMIPVRKQLGCALIVAAQFNRSNEKDNRPPTRTDFRDSGSLEEDAHRIIAVHRPAEDDDGNDQTCNAGYRAWYDQEIYQLKLRDGPLAYSRLKFFAPCTRFVEK